MSALSRSRPSARTTLVRLAPLALATLLSACSNSQEGNLQDSKPRAATAGCDASRVDHFIGENVSGYIERQATEESGATSSRTLKPGDIVTMDYDPLRLNIHVDPGRVIIKMACG